MKICYAVQVCDVTSNQVKTRFASDNRSEITEKCLTSLLNSIVYVNKMEPGETEHHVCFFDDNSSLRVKKFLQNLKNRFECDYIKIEIIELEEHGIMNSIGSCWRWLSKQNTDFVYQVQDDYMFYETAIYEMIDIYIQLMQDIQLETIVLPYNFPIIWKQYQYQATPRCIIQGAKRLWIQTYDTPCTFFTSKTQFEKHWKYYDIFLSLSPTNENLETISLNRIFSETGALGVLPLNSLAFHLQGERELDPYTDWRPLWDSIETDPCE